MTAGLLLIAAALGFVLYNNWDSRRAGDAAEEAREALRISMEHRNPSAVPQFGSSDFSSASVPASVPDSAQPDMEGESAPVYANRPTLPDTVPAVPVMPSEELDGSLYIGILEIPSLSLSLPVMENWDYDKLKIAPCRYTGNLYADDLVIAAHNYASHFGKIGTLSNGAELIFTDMKGEKHIYTVCDLEQIPGTAVEQMQFGSADDWDLTLFTCTLNGQSRVTVRAERRE